MAMPAPPRPPGPPCAFLRRGAVALALLGVACGVSPKPEPPITVPKPPTLDDSLVSCRTAEQRDGDQAHTLIVGSPGAVDPEEGLVRAYNLDDTSAPVEAPVDENGGFEIELGVEPEDEVRLELIVGDAAWGPRDLVVRTLDGALEPVVPPLGDCLGLDPGGLLRVKAKADGELRVQDTCGHGIDLGAPRPRSDRDRIDVGADQDWPLTLEKDIPVTISIEVLEGKPGDEYLFFLEATAPQKDRRAVSVRIEE